MCGVVMQTLRGGVMAENRIISIDICGRDLQFSLPMITATDWHTEQKKSSALWKSMNKLMSFTISVRFSSSSCGQQSFIHCRNLHFACVCLGDGFVWPAVSLVAVLYIYVCIFVDTAAG